MNGVSEAIGLSLPGNAAIPAPYEARCQMAYESGRRIVAMAHEDLRPSKILSGAAFLNAIRVMTAIGGSPNARTHIIAMARHAGIELTTADFMTFGYQIPRLVNMQPAGTYLGEDFYHAGGVPAVMFELLGAGKFDGDALTVTGRSQAENLEGRMASDRDVIAAFDRPFPDRTGHLVRLRV